jgi:hypothetical protein
MRGIEALFLVLSSFIVYMSQSVLWSFRQLVNLVNLKIVTSPFIDDLQIFILNLIPLTLFHRKVSACVVE